LEVIRGRYLPAAVVAWGEPFDSPIWEGRTGPSTNGMAFVCHDYACRTPVSRVEDLADQLAATVG
jgi:uncharacterized protein YyaL (SSP411 family)